MSIFTPGRERRSNSLKVSEIPTAYLFPPCFMFPRRLKIESCAYSNLGHGSKFLSQFLKTGLPPGYTPNFNSIYTITFFSCNHCCTLDSCTKNSLTFMITSSIDYIIRHISRNCHSLYFSQYEAR